jgi:hypothetical protein
MADITGEDVPWDVNGYVPQEWQERLLAFESQLQRNANWPCQNRMEYNVNNRTAGDLFIQLVGAQIGKARMMLR